MPAVTIVSTPNISAQPAASDAATDDAASGEDFANLLQGQLTAVEEPSTVATTLASALPMVAVKSSGKDDDAAQTADEGAVDANSLLAALALITPQVSNDTAKALTSDTASVGDSTAQSGASAALSALSATLSQAAGLKAQNQNSTQQGNADLDTAASSDTAANFAVAVAATSEKPAQLEASEDSTTETIDIGADNLHAGAHALSGKHADAVDSESSLTVTTPVRSQEWATEFSHKITWLATSDTQSAQLKINPQDLGPIEVSLNIDNGNASVSFTSANSEVRNAIETALPRLREMFASAGIELGQTNVGAESFNQQSGNGQGQQSASRSFDDNAILAADTVSSVQTRVLSMQRGNGLVDLFA